MQKASWAAAILGALAVTGAIVADPPAAPPATTQSPHAITEVGGKEFKQWMSELKHPDPSVRSWAIINIVAFGERAGEAVPLILDRLSDRDASCRAKAVIALKYMHVPDRHIDKVIDALARRLAEDTQGIIRYEATLALGRWANQAQAAIPALLLTVTDGATYEIRQTSIIVLRQAGSDLRKGPDSRVTRALVKALQDTVEKVRLEATVSLGAMGPPTDPQVLTFVIHALEQQLTYKDKNIALWSHVSLLAISNVLPEKSLQTILKMLQSPEGEIRLQVLQALTAIGPKAKAGVPAVLDALNDKEPEIVAAACMALVRLGDHGEKVRAAIIKVTERKERALIWYACQALGEMGPQPDVLDALTRVTKRKELEDDFLQGIGKLLEQVKKGKDKRAKG